VSKQSPKVLSTFDLVEALQTGHAVSALHRLKILALLRCPTTAKALATERRVDPRLLRGALEYVTERTDLIRKVGARFVATSNYSDHARFLLDLYAGAYGPNAVQLEKLLRRPSLAPTVVDRSRHAQAFKQVGAVGLEWVAGIVRQLHFNYVLDIGCGPATLLVQLAKQDPEFFGWGLELNPAMCRAAQAAIRASRVGRQVKLLAGDSRRLQSLFPAALRSSIHTVTACQVANEMFGDGESSILRWLRGIRTVFPGRHLLISDYYGRLGKGLRVPSRETLLHDYAQLISGQGIPPAFRSEWQALYSRAGCRLVHVIEDTNTTRFMHIVLL
jgi:SAM-dependent methyltransferase